ncbi:hypothetical protein NPIL_85151 [Nephila pilipes]|uniref:Uncharacterized protein n=1 Tax=Nephila pilipes TaxID=299642 RepID=A0A8X6TCD5_NEPPI|nr:hypothetical protein NPIL_389351 [Nephila pilipes]GFS93269.1 hypothetical protein NPIL_85151 [Nephila pilipes]
MTKKNEDNKITMTTDTGTQTIANTITTLKKSSSYTYKEIKISKHTQTDTYTIDSSLSAVRKKSPRPVRQQETNMSTPFQETPTQEENPCNIFINSNILNENKFKQPNSTNPNANHDEIDTFFTLSSLSVSSSNTIEQKTKKKKSTWKKLKNTISKLLCPSKRKNSKKSQQI